MLGDQTTVGWAGDTPGRVAIGGFEYGEAEVRAKPGVGVGWGTATVTAGVGAGSTSLRMSRWMTTEVGRSSSVDR